MSMIVLEIALPMIRNQSKMYGGTIHQLKEEIKTKYGYDFTVLELLEPQKILNQLSMEEFKEYYKLGMNYVLTWNAWNKEIYTFESLLHDFKCPIGIIINASRLPFLAYFIGYMDGLMAIIPVVQE